jgi:hypothetical protein
MTRIVKFVGKLLVLVLAIYGLVILVFGFVGSFRWAEAVQPFVRGTVSATGHVVRQELNTRSDQQMEQDGELLGRKLYPAAKGFLKGQLEAFKADPNKEALRKTVQEATHELSKELVAPVTEGVTETSRKVLQDFGNVLQELQKTLKEVPTPPAPGPPPAQ